MITMPFQNYFFLFNVIMFKFSLSFKLTYIIFMMNYILNWLIVAEICWYFLIYVAYAITNINLFQDESTNINVAATRTALHHMLYGRTVNMSSWSSVLHLSLFRKICDPNRSVLPTYLLHILVPICGPKLYRHNRMHPYSSEGVIKINYLNHLMREI